jgi:hypothetical protein
MSKQLKINNLEFDQIKNNLIEFLKGQDKFKDYNFKASGFDVLLDLLAYNTHYMSFYAHMLANESFIDSAYTRQAVLSKAKLLNYIPKNSQAAVAEVVISVDVGTTPPTNGNILFKRGDFAKSVKDNPTLDGRNFILLDDVYVYNKSGNENIYDYKSDVVQIYEGNFISEKFIVDTSQLTQRFVLKRKNVDYKTIRVKVYPDETAIGTDNFIPYHLASDFISIKGDTPVFFLTTNEDEYYELLFGKRINGNDSVYGMPVEHGNVIEVHYVETNGELGNDSSNFEYIGDVSYQIAIEVISPSDGGRSAETLDELKFNIPYHYRRQNRVHSISDYKSVLLSEYPNISSINVWGGEDNIPKVYGSVFICIKPKYGDVLSSFAKENIVNNILEKYIIPPIKPVLVDADFLYINLDQYISFDPTKTDLTSGEIVNKVKRITLEYGNEDVSKFDSMFSESKLSSKILQVDDSIESVYTDITIEKRIIPSLFTSQIYKIEFMHEILKNTFKSSIFRHELKDSFLYDDNGTIKMKKYNKDENIWEIDEREWGFIDLTTGYIKLVQIEFEDVKNEFGYISFFTEPKNPDFYSIRNNLVKINNIKTEIKDNG